VFSFYLSKPAPGRSYADSTPAKIALKATGNLFAPKKEADTKELEDLLSAIVAAKKN
jgi:biopolymer transport protein ExbD